MVQVVVMGWTVSYSIDSCWLVRLRPIDLMYCAVRYSRGVQHFCCWHSPVHWEGSEKKIGNHHFHLTFFLAALGLLAHPTVGIEDN